MNVKDLDSLECPVCQTVIKFTKKFLVSIDPSERRTFIKYVSTSKDVFQKYVDFVDYFDRRSQTFKTLTSVHAWAIKNGGKKYIGLYRMIAREESDFLTRNKTHFNPDDMLQGES